MNRRTRSYLVAVALAAVLSGCQTLPPPVPEDAPAGTRLDVPFHAQEKYQCGPAALAMALNFAGHPVTPDELIDEIWLPESEGSLFLELPGAARARGRLAYTIRTPEELFAQLDASYPVLVMQNLGLRIWPQWHFAVVTGYKNGGERILLHTGTDQSETSHWNRFIRTWARADYRALVIPPPGKLPTNAEPQKLVRALNDLKNAAGPEAALPYWRATIQQWPENYLVQFGWGNLQWQRGNRQEAIDAFQRAVEIRPDAASAWNNLAEAWRQLGCAERATDAIEKALEIAPERATIRASREQIQNMPDSACPSNVPEPDAR